MDAGTLVGRLTDVVRRHEEERAAVALPRFEIVGELRRGGMGVVYHAWDPQLGRRVALKVLIERPETSVEARDRFSREAQLAARLNHPNIVPIYETGTWLGQFYIAMQFIEGTTIDRAGLDLRATLAAIRDVALALQCAHAQGIVHRDVKPGNIMVDRQGRVFVTDFGLAKKLDAPAKITLSGVIMGTAAYMAPEQARGEEVDGRADIYSLGATLYELLTGLPPFNEPDAMATVQRVIREAPLGPRRRDPTIPRPVERIILKAMAKDRDDRYATAGELAEDLQRCLDGKRVRAPAPRRLPLPLIALPLAAILAVALWALAGPRREAPGAERLLILQEHIERGEIEDARAVLAALRRELGDGHPRLQRPAARLQERVEGLLARDATLLVDRLVAGDEEGAAPIRRRMTGLDESRARVRVDDAEKTVARWRELERLAAGHLSAGDFPALLADVRETRALGLSDHARSSIHRRLSGDLLADARARHSADALAVLREIDPANPAVDELERAVRLKALRAQAAMPGLAAADLSAILRQMESVDTSSPLTEEVRRLHDERLASERKLLERRVLADLLWQDGVAAFGDGARSRLDRAIQGLQAVGDDRVARLRSAAAWLEQLEAARQAADRAEGSAAIPDTAGLPAEFVAAAVGHVRALDSEMRRAQARRLGRLVVEACDRWELPAPEQLEEMERLAREGMDAEVATARERVARVRETNGAVEECRSQLAGRRLADARRSFEALIQRAPEHPQIPGLLELLAERQEVESYLAGYRGLAEAGALAKKGARSRLSASLVRMARSAAEPRDAWRAALIAVENASDADGLEKAVLDRRLGRLDAGLRGLAQASAAEELLVRGQLKYLKRSFGEAIEDFEKAARAGAGARAEYWRGVCEDMLGRAAPASQALREAIRLGVAGGDAHHRLATLCVEAQQFDEAISRANEALDRREPLSDDELAARGAEQLRYSLALQGFERDARYVLARALYGRARNDDCVEQCTAALALDANFAQAAFLRGVARYATGRVSEALADFERTAGLSKGPESKERLEQAQLWVEKCRQKLGE